MHSLFVGADVSKDLFSAAGVDGEGKELFSESYEMNAHGFWEFLKSVSSHCEKLDQVLVGMESTGCYHINLYSFLMGQGIDAVVINPLLIANFAKLSLRKTKTDKKDATTIAKFLMVHQDGISQLSISQDLQDLRDMARERESLCHLMAATKTEIKRILRTTFSELEGLCDPFSRVMLDFLQAFPSARLVQMAKPTRIAKALKRKGVGHKLSFCSEDVIRAAKGSVATVSPAKESFFRAR
jgi:transposase